MNGVAQNKDGYVEGTYYPDGSPGPRTVIRVDCWRLERNAPVNVTIRVTTYDHKAPPF
jgi:hypothetical protein